MDRDEARNGRGPGPEESQLGISRRTLLRRGAVVGAGVAWAAPTVTRMAPPAFGAVASPRPPEDRDGKAISFLAVAVETDSGKIYRVKWEDGPDDWESDPGPPTPPGGPSGACYPAGYFDGEPEHGGLLGLSVEQDASDPSRAIVTVPVTLSTGETVEQARGAAFGGGDCDKQSCSPGPAECTLVLDL